MKGLNEDLLNFSDTRVCMSQVSNSANEILAISLWMLGAGEETFLSTQVIRVTPSIPDRRLWFCLMEQKQTGERP